MSNSQDGSSRRDAGGGGQPSPRSTGGVVRNAFDFSTRGLALVGSIGVIAMMLHVCADVALRVVGGRPIPATVEIVSHYYMVLIAFLPLAWVERRDGMISIAIIEPLLPRSVLRVSDVLVALLVATVYALLAWITFQSALRSYASGTFVIVLSERLATWPSYFLPPAGFALAMIASLARAVERAVNATAREATE